MPVKQWIRSANFAIEGILHAAKTQRHLRYHFYSAAFVLLLSYALGVTRSEFLFISLAVLTVLVAEMMNTAIEVIVDMLSPEIREKARIAKDMAAGAVLITALGAMLLGYMVLFPYIRTLPLRGFRIAEHPGDEIAVVSVIIVLILVTLLKAYFGKGHPLSGGMPSGHAAVAFSVWVSVTFVSGNVFVSALCLGLAYAIAQNRVSTGVHSPLEAVAGAAIGSAVTLGMFLVFQ